MILQAIRMFFCMTLLTGVIYPLLMTGIAELFMSKKAGGSLVYFQDRAIGAKNIAQKFESPKYFWARPSFHDYNPLKSGGSNFGPTSKALKKAVEKRQERILKEHPMNKRFIPTELLFASASGLDPHISQSTAYFQMERVAKARGRTVKEISDMIDAMSIRPFFGPNGPYVNVLLLNKALDEVFHGQ